MSVIAVAHLVGAQLGSYEIQALMGSGGMASVYRGFDVNLRRDVAIKVLSEEAATQPGLAARFRQEAQIIAGLHHPHIVKIYDFGEQDGLTYMIQELLPGPTLEARLRDLAARGQRMDRDTVLAIVAQLAGTLDAAHAAGIIHRDVKPANAIWNAAGALTLTDFGIAKNTLGAAHQTQVGIVIGTPNYLSPEQARGLNLTHASDIYSLGVVLYELLAGKPPFEGDTMSVVIDHIQTAPPPLGQVRPDLPADVEAVVQQALAKDPAARFNSAAVLARALEQAWPGAPVPVVPAPTDVHNQATRLWEGRPGAALTPAATGPTQIQHAPPAVPKAPIVAGAAKPRSLLPLLGGLLALFLLGGVALAARSARGSDTAQASAVPTSAAVRTAAPAAAATAVPAPQPTAAPASQPSPVPVESVTSLNQLRLLLKNGVEAGQAGADGPALLAHLDEIERALAGGDKETASAHMRELTKVLLEGAANESVNPNLAQQSFQLIGAV
ncbi:MAG TPA: serine/threonine-protein kinase, partial [Roseiflexaceae bacterium]|nr:serine/threonine-protein kinase [Roseiflexaceae bacterium]